MTSYQYEIGSRRRKTARLIGQVQDEIVRAFVNEKVFQNITQDDVAAKLEVDKSVVSKDFNKHINMTLSKVADYAWALDYDVSFKLYKNHGAISEVAFEDARIDTDSSYEIIDDAE